MIFASSLRPRTRSALWKRCGSEFAQDVAHEKVEHITVDPNIAVVAVVGEKMRGTPGVAGRTFSALGREHVNIIAIAQGSSECNISFVVEEQHMKAALAATASRVCPRRSRRAGTLRDPLLRRDERKDCKRASED